MKALVKRGEEVGTYLIPHKHKDGRYVLRKSRYKEDYVYLDSLTEVRKMAKAGCSVRMSNLDSETHKAPSLIKPTTIEFD